MLHPLTSYISYSCTVRETSFVTVECRIYRKRILKYSEKYIFCCTKLFLFYLDNRQKCPMKKKKKNSSVYRRDKYFFNIFLLNFRGTIGKRG